MPTVPNDVDEFVHKCQTDPVWWVETFLKARLWKKQQEILNAIVNNRRISVSSGHDLGKSFISASAALWFLFSFPESKVITTSTTFVQTRTVLWSEIRTLHKRLSDHFTFTGEIFQVELRLDTNWWAMGISPDRPDALQGRHAQDMLVIVDEACGIGYEMFYALEGICTAETNKMLLIGNPTDPNTYFGHTHSGKISGWKRMSMSCYESPNIYMGPDGDYVDKDPLPHPYLVSMKWIKEKRDQWGMTHPEYIARVLGQFPDRAEDQLISNRYIQQAVVKGMVLRQVLKELQEGSQVISSANIRKLSL